ncbi:MAG TPA: hypothetical protein VIC30_12040 [Orrella sp.]
MAKKQRQKKQGSPFTFIFMAVLAYLAGFPIWIVFIVGLVGLLLWQVQRAQQGSSKLPPLPPAESDTSETETESAPQPRGYNPVPEKLTPAPQTYRETPTQEAPPWAQADYQAYPTEVSTQPARQPTPAMTTRPAARPPIGSTSGTLGRSSRLHPLARNLQTRDAARQAIIAMTVLGQPRSLQPYEFDPIQQGDVAPPRSS